MPTPVAGRPLDFLVSFYFLGGRRSGDPGDPVCAGRKGAQDHRKLERSTAGALGATLGEIFLARRFTPAGLPWSFNWMTLSRCSCSARALHCTDLCEHREHVEVVRGALDLTAL